MIFVPSGASVTMLLETLTPAKTRHECGLQKWTSASQRRVLCHCISLHFVLMLDLTTGGESVDRGEAHIPCPSLQMFN